MSIFAHNTIEYNLKNIFFICSLIYICVNTQAQNQIEIGQLRSDYILKENRVLFREQFKQRTKNTLTGSLSKQNEKLWMSRFREVSLNLYMSNDVLEGLTKAIRYAESSSPKFQSSAIETIYTLCPDFSRNEIYNIFMNTKDVNVFGTASYFLLNHPSNPLEAKIISEMLVQKFPGWADDKILSMLKSDLDGEYPFPTRSQLTALLRHDFQKDKTIIYTFHRKNRKFPGVTVIKQPDGKFVRDDYGKILGINQLALSVSNLPGYLSQGNTPQGIFSIVGFYVSPTESIGPTANVITRIPFEVAPKIFYHDAAKNSDWKIDNYINLLPTELKNFVPILESFYAGKMGRRLIVMHGSTDDLTFYEGQPYYPLTPSKGCITAKEIWDENTGRCIESDQVKLMNAYFSTGELKGFLVVINLDNQQKPVSLDDISEFIIEAEK